jgi:hypothetical protein
MYLNGVIMRKVHKELDILNQTLTLHFKNVKVKASPRRSKRLLGHLENNLLARIVAMQSKGHPLLMETIQYIIFQSEGYGSSQHFIKTLSRCGVDKSLRSYPKFCLRSAQMTK